LEPPRKKARLEEAPLDGNEHANLAAKKQFQPEQKKEKKQQKLLAFHDEFSDFFTTSRSMIIRFSMSFPIVSNIISS
jgi:hypothetical protein